MENTQQTNDALLHETQERITALLMGCQYDEWAFECMIHILESFRHKEGIEVVDYIDTLQRFIFTQTADFDSASRKYLKTIVKDKSQAKAAG